jgi:hypothetical protein
MPHEPAQAQEPEVCYGGSGTPPAEDSWAGGMWRRIGGRWTWTVFGYEDIDWGEPPGHGSQPGG